MARGVAISLVGISLQLALLTLAVPGGASVGWTGLASFVAVFIACARAWIEDADRKRDAGAH